MFSITHHSTAIEGSTLTEIETQILLEDGLTPKGKPLTHTLMVKDHLTALQFVIEKANQKTSVEDTLVKQINAKVLQTTGAVYNTVFGEIDSSKGLYRKANVRAGNRYFVNYQKIDKLTKDLCSQIQKEMSDVSNIQQQLICSFDAHFELVSIHPFYDGNGRTSRLLMNFIQSYFNLPLSLVFKEDKNDYYQALEDAREKKDKTIFYEFMSLQYIKLLEKEIASYDC